MAIFNSKLLVYQRVNLQFTEEGFPFAKLNNTRGLTELRALTSPDFPFNPNETGFLWLHHGINMVPLLVNQYVPHELGMARSHPESPRGRACASHRATGSHAHRRHQTQRTILGEFMDRRMPGEGMGSLPCGFHPFESFESKIFGIHMEHSENPPFFSVEFV